jgi:hypothetical protein
LRRLTSVLVLPFKSTRSIGLAARSNALGKKQA